MALALVTVTSVVLYHGTMRAIRYADNDTNNITQAEDIINNQLNDYTESVNQSNTNRSGGSTADNLLLGMDSIVSSLQSALDNVNAYSDTSTEIKNIISSPDATSYEKLFALLAVLAVAEKDTNFGGRKTIRAIVNCINSQQAVYTAVPVEESKDELQGFVKRT